MSVSGVHVYDADPCVYTQTDAKIVVYQCDILIQLRRFEQPFTHIYMHTYVYTYIYTHTYKRA